MIAIDTPKPRKRREDAPDRKRRPIELKKPSWKHVPHEIRYPRFPWSR